MTNESPFFGKLVQFTDRFGRTFTGTVVRTTTFAHCPGANSYTVYVSDPESSRVYGLPLSGFKVVGEGDIEAARQDYKQHLMQYPAWVKNFENGIGVGF